MAWVLEENLLQCREEEVKSTLLSSDKRPGEDARAAMSDRHFGPLRLVEDDDEDDDFFDDDEDDDFEDDEDDLFDDDDDEWDDDEDWDADEDDDEDEEID